MNIRLPVTAFHDTVLYGTVNHGEDSDFLAVALGSLHRNIRTTKTSINGNGRIKQRKQGKTVGAVLVIRYV